jgi:hypothetical protein
MPEETKDQAGPSEAEKPAGEAGAAGGEKPAEEHRAGAMAKEAAREAAEAARAASEDAFKAVKLLVSDPVGKLPEAYVNLGEKRAMAAGVVFGVVFDLCVAISGFLLLRTRAGGSTAGVGLGDILKLVIVGAVPFISLALGGLVSRKLFGGEGAFRKDLFVAGAALLPMAILLVVAGIFWTKVDLIVVAAISFGVSFSVLMLYAACTEMNKITKRAASLAVPVMLLVAGGITHLVVWVLKIG